MWKEQIRGRVVHPAPQTPAAFLHGFKYFCSDKKGSCSFVPILWRCNVVIQNRPAGRQLLWPRGSQVLFECSHTQTVNQVDWCTANLCNRLLIALTSCGHVRLSSCCFDFRCNKPPGAGNRCLSLHLTTSWSLSERYGRQITHKMVPCCNCNYSGLRSLRSLRSPFGQVLRLDVKSSGSLNQEKKQSTDGLSWPSVSATTYCNDIESVAGSVLCAGRWVLFRGSVISGGCL